MNTFRFPFSAAFIISLFSCKFLAAFPQPNNIRSSTPSLGVGYNSKAGHFLNRVIDVTEPEYSGGQKSDWKIETNMSAQEKALKISGSAEANLSFSVFSGSGNFDLNMVSRTDKQSFSFSAIFDVAGKPVSIKEPCLTKRMEPIAKRIDAFDVFGDYYVSEIKLGGRLFLDVVVDCFNSEEESDIGGGISISMMELISGNADARVTDALKNKNIDVSVRASQIGGDVSQLNQIFGHEGKLKTCSKGNLDTCFELIESVRKYSEEFGKQLNMMKYDSKDPTGPAAVGFSLSKYNEAAIQIGPKIEKSAVGAHNNSSLRQKLTEEYFLLIADHNFIKRRRDLGYHSSQYEEIEKIIEENARELVDIIEKTSEYPDLLPTEYNRYKEIKKKYLDPGEIKVDKKVDKKSPLGQLFEAVQKGDQAEALEQIKMFGPRSIREYNEFGDSPFHCAVRAGQYKMVKMLLDQEERYKPKEGTAAPLELTALQCDSVEGYTPLCIAAEGGTYEHILCMNILRAAGAGVDSRSKDALTPLQVAARCGKLDTTRKLLSIGAKDDVRDIHGRTLLHLAAGSGNADLIEYLIKERGFAIDAHDEDLMTPLHIAAKKGQYSSVNCLIRFGAKKGAKDRYGKIALDFGLGHEKVVSALLPFCELNLAASSQEHPDGALVVAFSPDGAMLASGGHNNTIKIWDARSGELLHNLRDSNIVPSVAFSPDSKTLASGSCDNTIKLWNTQSGELLHTIRGNSISGVRVAFSPDGNMLASGSDDNTIRLWDAQSSELLHTLKGHSNIVFGVAFSPDGTTLISGSFDKTVRLWNARSGELLHTLKGHSNFVFDVAFSPDGNTLASGGNDSTIKLWNARSGELLHTIRVHASSVLSVAFSPDSSMLASGSCDNTVRFWNARNGELLHTIRGNSISGVRVAFSPDGNTLASGSDDETVKIWDLRMDSILHQAIRAKKARVVQMIVKKFPLLPFIRTIDGQSPLELAIDLQKAANDSGSELSEIIMFLNKN